MRYEYHVHSARIDSGTGKDVSLKITLSDDAKWTVVLLQCVLRVVTSKHKLCSWWPLINGHYRDYLAVEAISGDPRVYYFAASNLYSRWRLKIEVKQQRMAQQVRQEKINVLWVVRGTILIEVLFRSADIRISHRQAQLHGPSGTPT